MAAHANPYVGPIIKLSPSGVEDWNKCRRYYLNKTLLDVPPSDADAGVFIGLDTHRILEQLHAGPGCADDERLSDLLQGFPDEHAARIKHHVECHRLLCPDGPSVDWAQHEHTCV